MAREVDDTSAPRFYAMVKELAQRAELPMPRVYLIDEATEDWLRQLRDRAYVEIRTDDK